MATELRATGFGIGQGVRTALPNGAAYLNVGQIGLAVPAFHRWLADRPDVTAVAMLHDVIPLDRPELVEPSSVPHHRRMVRTAAHTAHGLIVSTQAASARVRAAIERHRGRPIITLVRGLPLPRAFALPRVADPLIEGIRYFVVCGSIEPRKNLALLFEVWRRLRARLGAETPRLVIVGAPGWRGDAILRALWDEPALQERVLHVAGLSSPALARLILGASAVLCPSHDEGFGLTLFEADTLGVPTIASDIAAHREIAGPCTLLIGCDDAGGWADAIQAMVPAGLRRTPTVAPDRSEQTYCRDILAFVAACARERAGLGMQGADR